MSQTRTNPIRITKDYIEDAQSAGNAMYPNSSPVLTHELPRAKFDDVTQQILFCQNGIDSLNRSPGNSGGLKASDSFTEEPNPADEELKVDIESNSYEYDSSSFALNCVHSCSVVSIISPSAFTIQLTRDFAECDDFLKSMNYYYNSISDLHIPPEYLRKSLLCVTFTEGTMTWNRSQIMEFDLDEDTVNVFYVDLNSWEENVPRSRIRFILTKYSARPVYLLDCRLSSIGPLGKNTDWNDAATKTFENVVHNRLCDVEPLDRRCDNMFYVNLFASHDEAYVCINDFLIHCKMAKPVDDTTLDICNAVTLADDGQPMHPMIALYWKAGQIISETNIPLQQHDDGHESPESPLPKETNSPHLTRVIKIDDKIKIIFAKYNFYIMLPYFVVSNILSEIDEDAIQSLASKVGFKPVTIDHLTHPLLCTQLLKLVTPTPTTSTESRISLYSIDCVRKILKTCNCQQTTIFEALDTARLAEASHDISFWEESGEN